MWDKVKELHTLKRRRYNNWHLIIINIRKKYLNISSSFDSNIINALLLDQDFLILLLFWKLYFPVFLVKEASNYFSPCPTREKYFCQNFKGLPE